MSSNQALANQLEAYDSSNHAYRIVDVSGTPGSPGSVATAEINPLEGYSLNNYEATGGSEYIGMENADGAWVIKQYTSGTMLYAKGTSGYTTAWTNKASQTYDTFNNTFDAVVGSVVTSTTTITSSVQATDSASIDAFSRWRTSEPNYVFDTNFQYDLQPLVYQAVTAQSGATVTHDSTNRNALMTLSSTPTGGKAYMQTYEHFRYQAGRSQLIFQTFNFVETKTNTLKFVGYGDGSNGIELQLSDSTLQLALLSDTAKGDEAVAQADWNIDKMDGTGVSGKTIDITRTQIFVIDFQWLGVGRVRCGFDIDGVLYYVHEFKHANIQEVAYMQTANLPIRAGMTCTDTVSTTMRYICASVSSEGGETDVGGYNFSAEGTVTASSGARTHILSLRPKTTFNSITNRTKLVLESVDVLVTGNSPVKWELVLGQAISGTTSFNDVDTTYSAFEYNTAGTISGSPTLVIASGYCASSTQNKGSVNRTMANKYPITLDVAGAVRSMGTMSLIVTGLGGTSACRAVMNWREIR